MMMLIIQCLGALLLLLLAAGVAIRLIYPLPKLDPRPASQYLRDTAATPLGKGVATLAAHQSAHSGRSGTHLLYDGRDAFAARILLARAATRSLDIQYYIWRGDMSGTLMLQAVREAADRGVRVRLLLDDNGITGLDAVLAALDRHPNIEIRIFNPFVLRKPKMLGYLADFLRLNRRMHNKSFTADNQATVIGGRNIGDEYFGARDGGLFADLDVLAIGPVVEDVSRDFDRYWSSQSAYPAARILRSVGENDGNRLATHASRIEQDPAARAYVDSVRSLPFVEQVISGELPLEWATIRLVSDDPAKGIGMAQKEQLLAPALQKAIGQPQRKVRLISGYFVPTKAGADALSGLSEQGLDVAVFTNAFEATDVWIVHAGYAERRKALLRAGVRLFEMHGPHMADGQRGRRKLLATGSGSRAGSEGPVLRSANATLHAKTFAIDDERLFIGSFNFDPRSFHLNTELGFVIESPALATMVADAFANDIRNLAYEVVLTDDGHLNWRERAGDEVVVHALEPGTSRFQRWGIQLLARLPIEWLL